ncbi:MAG TPA: hypothetical protein VKZ74_00410 [Natronosporangium sp.]|nr:hypothetical protein [Natronosporangium sp.]
MIESETRMTQHSGPTSERTSTAPGRVSAPGAGTLAVLALAWLAAALSSARQSIGLAPQVDPLVLTRAALALPAVIAAALLAGAATGLAAFRLAARRRPTVARTRGSLALTTVAGAVVGGVAAATPVLAYADLPYLAAVCGATGAAGVLGGALAGLLPRPVMGAAVTGALAVFLVGFAVGLFDGDLLDLFSGGQTPESLATANAWVRLTTSLLAGVAAGVAGYAYLRRASVGQWPTYLLAGIAPGALLLLAELLTWVGGAGLFQLIGDGSPHDAAVLTFLNAARINRALIVLFAGGMIAIILFGRTLKPREAAGAEPEGESARDAPEH